VQKDSLVEWKEFWDGFESLAALTGRLIK